MSEDNLTGKYDDDVDSINDEFDDNQDSLIKHKKLTNFSDNNLMKMSRITSKISNGRLTSQNRESV